MEKELFKLRPTSLSEFIGQSKIKKELSVYLSSIKKRGEVFPHTFFIGPAGLGKTTLARIIAFELKREIKITSGPVIDKPGTIASLLTDLKEGDILFIDEIHRMPKVCQEILYSALEDYALDIVIGKGNSAKTIRLSLEKFTLIGATNKPNLCLPPLLDRFHLVFKLDYYSEEELAELIKLLCKKHGFLIEEKGALLLGKAAKGIPRQAVNLFIKLKEFIFFKKDSSQQEDPHLITTDEIKEFLKFLQIDEWGLTPEDRKCLLTLYKEFKGGPVGIEALALSMAISPEEMTTIYEPALVRLGFISRTKKGRMLTQKGYQYLSWLLNNKGFD